MAEEKKSFVLYADYNTTAKKLSDEQAGKLYKIILAYVNDENPVVDDFVLDIMFEPIKNQLKRDLDKWRNKKALRSEAGKIGGIKSGKSRSKSKQNEANEANASKSKQNEANEAVNVNVNVNGIVNDIVKENIQRVYSAYPNKCPIKNTSTGKCQKSKFKIQALLKTHTVDELVSMIEAYKTECISAKRYIKNFDTFLNNLPDLSEQELPINQVSSKKAYFQSIYPKDDITPTAERVLTEKFDGFKLAYKENLADYNISLQDILDQPINSIRFAIDGGHIKKRQ